MLESKYKGWLTDWTTLDNRQAFQVRIDSSDGYFIIEINPKTRESYIIKDRLNAKN